MSEQHFQNRLPTTNFSKMEAPISQEKIDVVLSKCKRHSSPGLDRISYEFYNAFPELLPLLNRVFNHCYFKEVVPHSWRECILKPIPKEGKNHSPVTNYRLIALLCTDFKILTILASRLQPILGKFFSKLGSLLEDLFMNLSLKYHHGHQWRDLSHVF